MPRGRDWTSDGHNGDAVEQGVGEAADLWVAPGPEKCDLLGDEVSAVRERETTVWCGGWNMKQPR
ncbi:unnamed protein product [Camellia sinensis]